MVFKARTARGIISVELNRSTSNTIGLNLDPSAGELGAQKERTTQDEKALRIVRLR